MIVISKFESVCQKDIVLYRNWSGEPDEHHRQWHNRSQQIASGHLSNTSKSSLEPASSIIQFHHTEYVS
jgi:hypothetical protein